MKLRYAIFRIQTFLNNVLKKCFSVLMKPF